jgi:catechol 2,3-dioxygenase-like lactoylglutathione lyase family enzyme
MMYNHTMSISSNSLVPELSVYDLSSSLKFYTQILGFAVAYERPEDGFAFIHLGEAHLMLDEIDKGRTWETAEFTKPLGRGINFQIRVASIEPLLEKLKQNGIKLFLEVEEKWYRKDDHEVGNKQFLVQDPDGYLLRFFEDMGRREIEIKP